MTACENSAPADQLTVVQGTVTSADTGRPLPGVLLAIQSYKVGVLGPVSYQRLDFNNHNLPGNKLDTLVYLNSFYPPAAGVKFHYYNLSAAGVLGKDTAVALVFQNPPACPPDTLRATRTFLR